MIEINGEKWYDYHDLAEITGQSRGRLATKMKLYDRKMIDYTRVKAFGKTVTKKRCFFSQETVTKFLSEEKKVHLYPPLTLIKLDKNYYVVDRLGNKKIIASISIDEKFVKK